ncbi:hypothetical protein AFLA70_325g001462 [Aspergillus flavus AF70]|nr:hypothetical protein AFLA70_325g001462 [Aspergillus flavus AF70]
MLPGVEDSMVPTKPDPLHGQLVHLVFVVESPSGTQPFFSWQSWCWSRPWQKGTNPSDTSINYELGLVVVEGQGIGEWKSTEAGLRWTSWEYESRPRWIVRLQNLPDQMVIRSGFCFGVSRTTQP